MENTVQLETQCLAASDAKPAVYLAVVESLVWNRVSEKPLHSETRPHMAISGILG